jgi:hypothetical protein
MAYYQIQYNIGSVYSGKSVTESGGNNIDMAKKIAKKRARELERGVRIFKDMGLMSVKGEWFSEK